MSQLTYDPACENAALRAIVEGVESETRDRFFYSLVRHLGLVLENVMERAVILSPGYDLPVASEQLPSMIEGEAVAPAAEKAASFESAQFVEYRPHYNQSEVKWIGIT